MSEFTQQFSKPTDTKLGHKIIKGMNRGHDKMHRWARKYIDFTSVNTALDIGCGGGINVFNIAKIKPDAKVYGIDYSQACVKKSIEFNKENIEKGKVDISFGDISKLDFENESFDLVSAFETIYFWPDLENNFKEVYRVLKNGGQFCLANECSDNAIGRFWAKRIDGMSVYDCNVVVDILIKAGFNSADIVCNNKKSLLKQFAIVATKKI